MMMMIVSYSLFALLEHVFRLMIEMLK